MNPWSFIASGFGSGLSPKAPGTFGSLVGLVIGCLLLEVGGHGALILGIVLATVIGVYAIRQLPEANQDPGWIVIDEIAGQMLPLLAIATVAFWQVLLAFLLFRFFDILKPGPVAWADQRKDEYGIMGDDLIAGGLALLVMLVLRRLIHL